MQLSAIYTAITTSGAVMGTTNPNWTSCRQAPSGNHVYSESGV